MKMYGHDHAALQTFYGVWTRSMEKLGKVTDPENRLELHQRFFDQVWTIPQMKENHKKDFNDKVDAAGLRLKKTTDPTNDWSDIYKWVCEKIETRIRYKAIDYGLEQASKARQLLISYVFTVSSINFDSKYDLAQLILTDYILT